MLAEGVSAPDPQTLVLRLTNPAPYYTFIAGLWVMYPARQDLIEAGGEDWWKDPTKQIGNGPFQVTQMAQDQLVTLNCEPELLGGQAQDRWARIRLHQGLVGSAGSLQGWPDRYLRSRSVANSGAQVRPSPGQGVPGLSRRELVCLWLQPDQRSRSRTRRCVKPSPMRSIARPTAK